MSLSRGPKITTAGLVLSYDAGTPRGYPGTGTTLYNIGGNANYNGSLNNGTAASSGYLRFADQADSITLGTNLFLPRTKTLSIWIRSDRPLSTQDNWEVGFLNQGSTVGTMFGFMYGVGECQDLGYWGYGASYDMSVESTTNKWSSDGNWHNGVITMDDSRVVRVWIDGVQKQWLLHSNYSTLSYTVTMPTDTTNYFLINSRSTWNSGLSYIDLGNVMVYNRPLTNAEIVQNYNAMKDRFA